MTDAELRRRAAAAGIDTWYRNAAGQCVTASTDTLRAVLAGLGDPARNPVIVARRGWPQPAPALAGASVALEDGGEVPLPATLPGRLPDGYHRIQWRRGETPLIVAPRTAYLPPVLRAGGRIGGYAVQLYQLRSHGSVGAGDLGGLEPLASAGDDPGFVLLNPLHAPELAAPMNPSPYCPSSRQFRNPVALAIDGLHDLARVPAAVITEARRQARLLNQAGLIDYDAAWAVKSRLLQAAHAALTPTRRAALAAYRAGTPGLARYATYCALRDTLAQPWQRWPALLRDGAAGALDGFAAGQTERISFYAYLQLLLDEQLEVLPRLRLGYIHDLALGVSGDGFDAWSWPDGSASGFSVGAPPDPLAPQGQDWGIVPIHPNRLVDASYQPFRRAVVVAMRHAAGIRIDHAPGLFRLYWIPHGGAAADGAYVRYPAEALLGILMLESQRTSCLVIGEDLGTVEPAMRHALSTRRMLGYRVATLDPDLHHYPRRALAAATTHDLAPLAGFLAGGDAAYRHRIGVLDDRQAVIVADAERRARRALRRRLGTGGGGSGATIEAMVEATYRLLAATRCMLVVVDVVDVADAASAWRRVNVPGSTNEHPNWRVALPVAAEELASRPGFQRLSSLVRRVG